MINGDNNLLERVIGSNTLIGLLISAAIIEFSLIVACLILIISPGIGSNNMKVIERVGTAHELIVETHSLSENISVEELESKETELAEHIKWLDEIENTDEHKEIKRLISEEIDAFNDLAESIKDNSDISYEYHQLKEEIEQMDRLLAEIKYSKK